MVQLKADGSTSFSASITILCAPRKVLWRIISQYHIRRLLLLLILTGLFSSSASSNQSIARSWFRSPNAIVYYEQRHGDEGAHVHTFSSSRCLCVPYLWCHQSIRRRHRTETYPFRQTSANSPPHRCGTLRRRRYFIHSWISWDACVDGVKGVSIHKAPGMRKAIKSAWRTAPYVKIPIVFYQFTLCSSLNSSSLIYQFSLQSVSMLSIIKNLHGDFAVSTPILLLINWLVVLVYY